MVFYVGSFNFLFEFYKDLEGEFLFLGKVNYDIGYNLDVRVYWVDVFSESGKLFRLNVIDLKIVRVSGLVKKKVLLLEIFIEIIIGDINYFELKKFLD